jgi:hypothetical protein
VALIAPAARAAALRALGVGVAGASAAPPRLSRNRASAAAEAPRSAAPLARFELVDLPPYKRGRRAASWLEFARDVEEWTRADGGGAAAASGGAAAGGAAGAGEWTEPPLLALELGDTSGSNALSDEAPRAWDAATSGSSASIRFAASAALCWVETQTARHSFPALSLCVAALASLGWG